MRADVADAVVRGRDPGKVIAEYVQRIGRIVGNGSLLAYAEALVAEGPKPVKFDLADAAAAAATRAQLDDVAIQSIVNRLGLRAATSLNAIGTIAEKAVREAAEVIVSQGLSAKDGKAAINAALSNAGLGATKPHLLETIYRYEFQTAYSAAQWNAVQDPAVAPQVWGYEYVSVGDDRVRPEHQALDGLRLPKDDPRWLSIWTPNGYGCRCQIVTIFNGDAEATATEYPTPFESDGRLVVPGPDEGFDFNPGVVLTTI
jgi:SPP1 gp7 family putative phage head morphogenesis protein